MKRLRSLLAALSIACAITLPPAGALIGGCTTSQQTATYKTLFGVEVATKGAVDAYFLSVAKGSVATNDVPKVSKAFNTFQASMNLAVQVAHNNSNAIAPANLVSESTALIGLISTLTGK